MFICVKTQRGHRAERRQSFRNVPYMSSAYHTQSLIRVAHLNSMSVTNLAAHVCDTVPVQKWYVKRQTVQDAAFIDRFGILPDDIARYKVS